MGENICKHCGQMFPPPPSITETEERVRSRAVEMGLNVVVAISILTFWLIGGLGLFCTALNGFVNDTSMQLFSIAGSALLVLIGAVCWSQWVESKQKS